MSDDTFVQPKITGYRQLNATEAALMNEIKAKGAELEALINRVQNHLREQMTSLHDYDGYLLPEWQQRREEIDIAQPQRWAAIARTDFQTGLMALTRAVAQPTSF